MNVILEVNPSFDFSLFSLLFVVLLLIFGTLFSVYKKREKEKYIRHKKEIDELIEKIKNSRGERSKEAAAEILVEKFLPLLPEGPDRQRIIVVLDTRMPNRDYWNTRAFDKITGIQSVKSR